MISIQGFFSFKCIQKLGADSVFHVMDDGICSRYVNGILSWQSFDDKQWAVTVINPYVCYGFHVKNFTSAVCICLPVHKKLIWHYWYVCCTTFEDRKQKSSLKKKNKMCKKNTGKNGEDWQLHLRLQIYCKIKNCRTLLFWKTAQYQSVYFMVKKKEAYKSWKSFSFLLVFFFCKQQKNVLCLEKQLILRKSDN